MMTNQPFWAGREKKKKEKEKETSKGEKLSKGRTKLEKGRGQTSRRKQQAERFKETEGTGTSDRCAREPAAVGDVGSPDQNPAAWAFIIILPEIFRPALGP